MTFDQAGINQAAAASYRNDPFYPRPAGDEADDALWKIFASHSLKRSVEILGAQSKLPEVIRSRLEELRRERRETVRSRSK